MHFEEAIWTAILGFSEPCWGRKPGFSKLQDLKIWLTCRGTFLIRSFNEFWWILGMPEMPKMWFSLRSGAIFDKFRKMMLGFNPCWKSDQKMQIFGAKLVSNRYKNRSSKLSENCKGFGSIFIWFWVDFGADFRLQDGCQNRQKS